MRLVVDTNILFSFFRENPVRSIIVNANQLGLELFTPEYAFEELQNNANDLLKYTKLKNENELEKIFTLLDLFVDKKSLSFFSDMKEEGKDISPDEKDAPFFALALKLKAEIWSNEPLLKQQSVIMVHSTPELRKVLTV